MSEHKKPAIKLSPRAADFVGVCKHREHDPLDVINAAVIKFSRMDQKTQDELITVQKKLREQQ